MEFVKNQWLKKNIIYYLLTQSVKDKYLTEKFLTRLLTYLGSPLECGCRFLIFEFSCKFY